jgi:hypothetical protein
MSSETEKASQALGAKMSSEVKFDEGKATLTQDSKDKIRDFVRDARAKGKIDEIKVAAWADREYPTKDTKASSADVKLADERLKELKKYLKDDLKVSSVDSYNMTERPNALQKFLKTPTANVKNTMEASGAAPKTESETGLFGQRAQSSKAVLMIYMQ